MYEAHKNDVAFFVVYIREAHPTDGHLPMEFGMIEDPITATERHAVAKRCVDALEIPIPAIVDGMDDAVSVAYHGWPERLYLVGRDGKIAYAGGPGPFQFEPDELEQAIQAALQEPR